MRHAEHSWSTFDGIPVYAQWWAPDGPARAAIVLVHGLAEHSGRYPRLVELLPAAGFAISAFDERGHGKTGGPRLFTPSYEALMKDIDRHLQKTRELFPGLPLFIYGHSHGGGQVLYYVLDRKPDVAGTVASSPATGSGTPQSPLKVAAAQLLSRIAPTMKIPLGPPAEALSSDPAWVQASLADPLFQEGLSVRLGTEMLKAGRWILSHDSFPTPLLIMQGTGDRHVSPALNIEFARRLPGDVTLKVWESMRHELHNEVVKDEVIAFARQWMEKHLK